MATVKIQDALKIRLVAAAEREGMTPEELVAKAIRAFLSGGAKDVVQLDKDDYDELRVQLAYADEHSRTAAEILKPMRGKSEDLGDAYDEIADVIGFVEEALKASKS